MAKRKDEFIPITVRFKPETMNEIEKRTLGSNLGKGEVIRALVEDALSQETVEGNKQIMREIFREEIARFMNPLSDRLIKILVKTFMQAATANALNQEVLAQLFSDEELTEEENLRYIKELVDSAGITAIKILKGNTDEYYGEEQE